MDLAPQLTRYAASGVTLLGDLRRPGGVTLAFTERTGGVSKPPYASLNLGSRCGDDPEAVAENRRRTLAALGASFGEILAMNALRHKSRHGKFFIGLPLILLAQLVAVWLLLKYL